MKKYILISILFLFTLTLNAMNWPSEDASLLSGFGTNDQGRPLLGMIFSGGTDILSSDSGEVIFTRNKKDASRLPSPLGSWIAIDHGDLISIYSRFEENKNINKNNRKRSSEKIASSGISGMSNTEGFYFQIFDRFQRRWINPELVLKPERRTRSPEILSVELRCERGSIVDSRNITQGRYTIFVNSRGGRGNDFITEDVNSRLAPHRIVCLVNGEEVDFLNFESFSVRDGVLMAHRSGLIPANRVYANFPFFETADVFFNRGQVNLEIISYDIHGNSRNVVHRFNVN